MLARAEERFDSFQLLPEDFDRYLPSIQGSDSHSYKNYLVRCQKCFEDLLFKNCRSDSLMALRSQMIDRLMVHLFYQAAGVLPFKKGEVFPVALIAQGGYGREEMSLHSDIDLLFLFKNKKGDLKVFAEKVLYPLWDLGLDVGYAVRTVGECKKLFFDDVTIMTSLLDARYITGDLSLFAELKKTIQKTISPITAQKKLMKMKLDEWKERIQKLGGAVFLLEPNVRDSLGGLRDIQLLSWIAKIQGMEGGLDVLKKEGLFKGDEYQHLLDGLNFLWMVRNHLHLLVGKKSDTLGFSYQEEIAKRLRYSDYSGILAVEKFMQDYYRTVQQVHRVTDTVIRRMTWRKQNIFKRFLTIPISDQFHIAEDQISVRKKNVFEKNPLNLIQIFEQVQKTGLSLHPETKDLIRSSLYLFEDKLLSNEKAIRSFRSMMNAYDNLGKVLMEMHDTQVLGEWLPEFKKVLCRVQHDVYHIYTIDTHSIFAVNELSKLAKGEYGDQFKIFREALREVVQPELLTLGLFLHDIGKGEGGSHSTKGAVIANKLTQRLGYSEEEQKTVEFLVLSHLMMPHLSQRRDLEDQELIIQFARSMGTVDRLNMLFLLTWGDMRAVGPNSWTDWKGTLLERLYFKTREVISRGEFSMEKTRERVARVKESLLSRMGERHNRETVGRFFSMMPPRYFFASSDENIERHFQLVSQARSEEVLVQQRYSAAQNLNEIMIYTVHSPQVLAQVTGVMLARSVNILKMDAFQTTDGHLLALVGVTDAGGKPIPQWEKFEGIAHELKEVLHGRMKVDELLARKEVPHYLAKKPVQKAESRVAIDNDVSAYYTVIDIYAHDRLGLLYEVMSTLNRMGCYVDVSKISTKVEQVSDVFYVKDLFGKKIMSNEKLKQIKEELLKVAGA